MKFEKYDTTFINDCKIIIMFLSGTLTLIVSDVVFVAFKFTAIYFELTFLNVFKFCLPEICK